MRQGAQVPAPCLPGAPLTEAAVTEQAVFETNPGADAKTEPTDLRAITVPLSAQYLGEGHGHTLDVRRGVAVVLALVLTQVGGVRDGVVVQN